MRAAGRGDRRSAPELRRETRFPYHPHVTVAQDVAPEALDKVYEDLADFSALFEVEAFTLFSHSGAARWQPRRDFRLAADAHAAGRCRSRDERIGEDRRVNLRPDRGGLDRRSTAGRRRSRRFDHFWRARITTHDLLGGGWPRRSPTTGSSRSSRSAWSRYSIFGFVIRRTTPGHGRPWRVPGREPAVPRPRRRSPRAAARSAWSAWSSWSSPGSAGWRRSAPRSG